MSSGNAASLDQSEFLSMVKEIITSEVVLCVHNVEQLQRYSLCSMKRELTVSQTSPGFDVSVVQVF